MIHGKIGEPLTISLTWMTQLIVGCLISIRTHALHKFRKTPDVGQFYLWIKNFCPVQVASVPSLYFVFMPPWSFEYQLPCGRCTLYLVTERTHGKKQLKNCEKRGFSEDLEYKSFCNLQVSCQLVGWMTFYRVIPILTAPLLVLFLAKVVIVVSRNSTFQQ